MKKKVKKITAEEFDRRADSGENIDDYLDHIALRNTLSWGKYKRRKNLIFIQIVS